MNVVSRTHEEASRRGDLYPDVLLNKVLISQTLQQVSSVKFSHVSPSRQRGQEDPKGRRFPPAPWGWDPGFPSSTGNFTPARRKQAANRAESRCLACASPSCSRPTESAVLRLPDAPLRTSAGERA